MTQLIAAAIVAVVFAGTPTPAIAQDGWTMMLLPGGTSAARSVLDLDSAPDQAGEFLLADLARHAYDAESDASKISTFRRYVTHLEEVAAAAATWPKGFARPTNTTPSSDRDRAKRFLDLLGLALGPGHTIAAGRTPDARERQAWLLAAGVNTTQMIEPLNAGATVTVTIPQGELPLPLPDFWRTLDTKQSALLTIIGSRQSALFYAGLLSLDARTLHYLSERPALATQLRNRHAAAFAATARAIQVHNGHVVPPGGPDATALWERLSGERLSAPDRFIPALLSADAGRLASFAVVVAGLDDTRRRWLLSAGGDDIYTILRRVERADVASIIRQLPTTAGDARTVLAWIFANDGNAEARLQACQAAHRISTTTPCTSHQELATLLDGATHTPTLLPLFARLRIIDGPAITAAIHTARQVRPLAPWQLMLGLIEQVAVRQQLSAERATSLLKSWTSAAAAPDSGADGKAAAWLVDTLLPTLAPEVTIDDLELYERDVIVSVAKRERSTSQPVKVFWEGIEYIVDDTFAATRDLLTIRVSQHSPTLGDVIRLRGVQKKLEAGLGDVSQLAEIAADVTRTVAATAKLRGRDGAELKIAGDFRKVDKTIREISSDREIPDAVAQLPRIREALDALLEGSLLPLVYALAVTPAGAPPATLLELPHWHTWERAAWEPAVRKVGPFMESVITGSVIGLDVAMADSRLRAVGRAVPMGEQKAADDFHRRAPVLRSMRVLGEHAEWVADAPRILKALAAGAAVIAESGEIPPDVDNRMRHAGIAPERIAMVRWQRQRGVPASQQAFTRLDAYRLGTTVPLPDGWSDADPVSEILLRLLEGTQSWKLPAGIVPALLPLATHDWLIRAVPVTRDRVEAYMLGLVSARVLVRPARSQHP